MRGIHEAKKKKEILIKNIIYRNNIKNGAHVDKNNMELFKYILYLYKISKTEIEDLNEENEDGERSILPHNRKRHRIRRPIEMWKDFVHFLRNVDEIKVFNKLSIFYEFEDLLENVLNNLYNVSYYHLFKFINPLYKL